MEKKILVIKHKTTKCNHRGCKNIFYTPKKLMGKHISFLESAMTRAGWQEDIYGKRFCVSCSKKHLI